MQYYHLKQETFQLQRLISNHLAVSTIDASLAAQHELLTNLTQMWPLFRKNLDALGSRLEGSLNQLAVGCDVIVEDSDLMLDQLSEIANQLTRANKALHSSEGKVKDPFDSSSLDL